MRTIPNLMSVVIYMAIVAIILVGEIKCIIKAVNCNWEPIDKAEIVYSGAAVIGLGCIVGYFEIEDK